MALTATASLAPHLASKLPAAHLAALVCRLPSLVVSSRIGDAAQARSFSCRAGRNVLLNVDHRKKFMDLWGRCSHDQDWQTRKKNKEMKMLRWIERGENMETFKKLLELATKRMQRPDVASRERADKMDSISKFMDSIMEKVSNQPDGTSRSSCKPQKGNIEDSVISSTPPHSSDLKITVYKRGEASSVTRIPESMLRLAGTIAKACTQPPNLDEVVRLMENSTIQGKILEHEQPKDDLKIVISVGDCSTQSIVQAAAPANLKIRTYNDAEDDPIMITTVSGGILHGAGNVIPNSAREAMKKHGVDLEEVVRFSTDPNARGVTILDHEDLEKKERVVISLE